jgi:photosystem II stability/assembly factor-like uncharacterized protein
MGDIVSTPYSRVFLIENGANPNTSPTYEGLWKAGGMSWGQGDITPIRIPSADSYGKFKIVGNIPGDQDLPELAITARYAFDLSDMLRLVNIGCNHDLQVHMGQCQNPSDFNGGWDKILVLEQARISNYTTSDLGAIEPGDNAVVNEEVTWQGQLVYEIGKLTATEVGSSTITRQVIAVAVCDQAGCGGVCGTGSDGCQKVFMVTLAAGGSAGLSADVIWSADGFSTSTLIHVTTLGLTESPDDAACVGDNLVIVSGGTGASDSLHYASIADILAGTQTWTEVDTGITASKGPQALWSLGPNETWFAGAGGYIYFSDDPTSGVTAQDEGVATTQDLNDIHMLDSTHGVAVGASNAVVRTVDGSTWGAITGPAVGVALNAVWMKSEDVWLVGTAGGALYYTADAGSTWTALGFSGSGAGTVTDIYFVNQAVGYMAHTTAAPVGRLFRTIDGGNSWYLLPENGSMPDNDGINSIKACSVNTVFAGGLGGGGTDGFGVKLTA